MGLLLYLFSPRSFKKTIWIKKYLLMVEPLKGKVIKMCDIANTMNFRGSREKFLLHSRFMNVGNVKKADFTINRFTILKK